MSESMTPLFDAHCHFDFPEFDGRRESILAALPEAGVLGLVIPGVRQSDWARVGATAATDDRLHYCIGVHPWFVAEHDLVDSMAEVEAYLQQAYRPPVALGECGLDALRPDPERQRAFFDAQIRLAMTVDKPLVVHSVRAHEDVYLALQRARFEGPCLIHGFSGSYEQAIRFAERECFVGVGGVITHPRARKTRDAVARLPLSALVLETDAPDMPPEGVERGHNSPLALRGIFNALCGLRQESPGLLAESLLDNVRRLYRGIPQKAWQS